MTRPKFIRHPIRWAKYPRNLRKYEEWCKKVEEEQRIATQHYLNVTAKWHD